MLKRYCRRSMGIHGADLEASKEDVGLSSCCTNDGASRTFSHVANVFLALTSVWED